MVSLGRAVFWWETARFLRLNEPNLPLPRLIFVIKQSKAAATRSELAKGQIWRLKHAYVQIVALGQRLLQYRMLESLEQEGVRTQTSGIDVMLQYLRTRGARLVSPKAPA